jgi:hypothetical protein
LVVSITVWYLASSTLKFDTRDGETPVVGPVNRGTGERYQDVAVIDVNDDNPAILLVDPADGSVRKRIPTGYEADIEIAGDPSTIFVTSRYGDQKDFTLTTFDPKDGRQLREVTVPNRWRSTLPSSPVMSANEAGTLVHVYQWSTVADEIVHSVATYDTQSGELLPQSADVPGCEAAALFALSDRRLAVLCQSNVVYLIEISTDGSSSRTQVVELPRTESANDPNGNDMELWRPAWGAVAPEENLLYVVSHSGSIFEVDLESAAVRATHELDLPTGEYVAFNKFMLSPSGDTALIGLTDVDNFDRVNAHRLILVDVPSWNQTDAFTPPLPLWDMGFSPSGEEVFGTNIRTGNLFVFDSSTFRTRSVFHGVAERAALLEGSE